MKTKIITTGIVLILSFLTVQVYAQDKATNFVKKENAIKKHNDQIFEHAKFMQNEARKSDDLFNRKSYLKRARKIKSHARKAKIYVGKLQTEENHVRNSETKFNEVIEHYDRILQEEFQIEKELGMPASDRHKLDSHLSIILNELEELRKKI